MPQALFKTLKWTLAGVFALLVIAIIAVEVVPWNFLKAPITERIEAATGRSAAIRGDLSLSLLPRPRIKLEQLAIANAGWARTAEMFTVESLDIRPSLTSLMTGNVVLDEVKLAHPVLNLQARSQQPGNWKLPAWTSPDGASKDHRKNPSGAGRSDPSVQMRQLTVSGAEIRYLPPGQTPAWIMAISSARVTTDNIHLTAELGREAGAGNRQLPIGLSAQYRSGIADGQWQLGDIRLTINNSEISGQLALDTRASPPTLNGTLNAPVIDVSRLRSGLPTPTESNDETGLTIPVLPAMKGNVGITIGQVKLQNMAMDNIQASVALTERRLALEHFNGDIAGGHVEATVKLSNSPDEISAKGSVKARNIDLVALGTSQQRGGIVDLTLDLRLRPVAQSPSISPGTLLNHLDFPDAQAFYQTPASVPGAASDLDLALTQAGEPLAPVLSVQGRFQGKPLDMTIEGAPLARLTEGISAYPLQAQARSGELSAWADGHLGAILSPATFNGNLVLEGPDGQDLERWIGPSVPPLPAYRLSTRLSRSGDRWSATSLNGTIGSATLAGEVHITTTDPPRVDADLNVGHVELARFTAGNRTASKTGSTTESSDNESPLRFLHTFNGELALEAKSLALPDTPKLTNLDVAASLQAGLLDVSSLHFDVGGGKVNSGFKVDATSQPASGELTSRFHGLALSQFGDTYSAIETRLGTLSGELNLEFTESSPGEPSADLLFPYIGRLAFAPSTVTFKDAEAGTDMTLKLQTHGLDSGQQTFHIDGEGRYDDAPFSVTFRGDPLLDVRDPDRPYALELTGDLVDSRVRIDGTILQPLTLKGLDLELDLTGPNPQRLTRLLGVPLPQLPPYSVSGDLALSERRWAFTNLTGRVGDSDLGGEVRFDTSRQPPHLSANLSSDSLDIDDLGGLVGKPSGRANSPADGNAAPSSGRDLLPDDPLFTDDWKRLTADVRYRGKSVRAADIPLSGVVIDFALDNGKAVFDPVRFGVGDGNVDFNLDLNIDSAPPEGTLELEVEAVNLAKALRNWPIAEGSVGIIGGQGKFWITGNSVAELAGSADGGLVALMTQGQLNALLVELAGLDLSQSVLSWIRGRDPLPIDCAYADLQTRDGQIRLDTFAVDTPDTTFTGNGTINMRNEQLDILVEAHPKDASVLSGRTPIHLGGTFSDVDTGISEGELALRAGGSVALAALATPVAALLPLLDLGAGDDVPYCDGLASRSARAIDDTRDDADETDNDES